MARGLVWRRFTDAEAQECRTQLAACKRRHWRPRWLFEIGRSLAASCDNWRIGVLGVIAVTGAQRRAAVPFTQAAVLLQCCHRGLAHCCVDHCQAGRDRPSRNVGLAVLAADPHTTRTHVVPVDTVHSSSRRPSRRS